MWCHRVLIGCGCTGFSRDELYNKGGCRSIDRSIAFSSLDESDLDTDRSVLGFSR